MQHVPPAIRQTHASKRKDPHRGRRNKLNANLMSKPKPAANVPWQIFDVSLSDSKKQHRVRRGDAVKKRSEGGPSCVGKDGSESAKRRNEEDGRLMSFGFDEELDKGGLNGLGDVSSIRSSTRAGCADDIIRGRVTAMKRSITDSR